MGRYGVAEPTNSLASLLDKAMAGEEVIITRHGKPIVELRPVANPGRRAAAFDYEWLRKQRDARKSVGMTSVALLKALHDESDL